MSYSNVLLAFFDGSSSDYRKSLKTGDRIASYTIREIQHNVVKLAADTNEVQLRIGMQMRRSEDGSWTAAEATSNSSPGAYVSNSRGDRDRGERRWNRSSNADSNSGRNSNGNQPQGESAAPMIAPGNLDPNDPVQRLMMRRMQEEGGGAPTMRIDAQAPNQTLILNETNSAEGALPQPPENGGDNSQPPPDEGPNRD
jgi:hypothetical protein